MEINTKEIFDILTEILGVSADGIFASYDTIDNGAEDFFYSDSSLSTPICGGSIANISSGITRLAILPIGKNYVIKLPITGLYGNPDCEYGCDDIENCEILMRVDLENFNIFEQEQSIYNTLFLESKEVFLPCEYVGDFNGIPVYVQEKVDKLQISAWKNLTPEEYTTVKNLTSSKHYEESVSRPLSPEFIMSLINNFGLEATGYIIEDCKNIDDLHANNYGYTKEGKPVIFDFAGYDGEMYEW